MSQLQIDSPDFRQRPKPVGAEIAYKIEGDTLVVDQMSKVQRVQLGAVESVCFTYHPGNISAQGFQTRLTLKDGKRLTFGNLSWRSFVDVDRQEDKYRQFAAQLCAAIAKANPACRFHAGRPLLLWLLFTLVACAATLGMALFGWSAWTRGQTSAALVALLFMAGGIWQVEPMVRLNRPRDLKTGEIPPDLMP